MKHIAAEHWLGFDDGAIDHHGLERPVHRQLVDPWQRLCREAAAAGLDLALASGYRDFGRQAAIWNGKARGRRPVHDDQGRLVAMTGLADRAKVAAIWRYSALPGTSRHHWGTDVDVYDRGALPAGQSPQLTPAEYAPGGPFWPLSRWLSQRIAEGRAEGFVRPYEVDRGGIAPEPWHLSWAPLAHRFEAALCPRELARCLRRERVELAELVLERLPWYWERYVLVGSGGRTADWKG